MWKRMKHALRAMWRRTRRGADERRTAEARARFWSGVQEGQREAEARHRS